jgi:hypothetical protein
MVAHTCIGWTIVALWCLGLSAEALEYRLHVTHLEFLTFSSYLDKSPTTPRGEETMARLETLLDRMEFPAAAVIPGREVVLLDDPNYGGSVPSRLVALPATKDQAWTTLLWDSNPGERVAFVVKSYMAAWQEVWGLAANPHGVLRRLTLGGPGLFGPQSTQVPTVSVNYIANAVDQQTFVPWLQTHAKAVGGMAFVVGRRNDVFTSVDRVYMLLTMPPEPSTFKVVIGWKDHDDRGNGKFFERPFRRW